MLRLPVQRVSQRFFALAYGLCFRLCVLLCQGKKLSGSESIHRVRKLHPPEIRVVLQRLTRCWVLIGLLKQPSGCVINLEFHTCPMGRPVLSTERFSLTIPERSVSLLLFLKERKGKKRKERWHETRSTIETPSLMPQPGYSGPRGSKGPP